MSQSKKFDKLLRRNLQKTVPVLKVSEVSENKTYLFFDAREEKEFNTSHLKNAKQIGYDFFNLEEILQQYPDKSKPIIVYCSIGIRSELIGEKLMKAGYLNVYNLYGGIFEWKNQSNVVVDKDEQPTEKVHTFSKEWSKWLLKGEKVYED
tara:strand:- start:40854 stop:41303 length:450 start_codon:yes stop_codon:yes gene_type:complete